MGPGSLVASAGHGAAGRHRCRHGGRCVRLAKAPGADRTCCSHDCRDYESPQGHTPIPNVECDPAGRAVARHHIGFPSSGATHEPRPQRPTGPTRRRLVLDRVLVNHRILNRKLIRGTPRTGMQPGPEARMKARTGHPPPTATLAAAPYPMLRYVEGRKVPREQHARRQGLHHPKSGEKTTKKKAISLTRESAQGIAHQHRSGARTMAIHGDPAQAENAPAGRRAVGLGPGRSGSGWSGSGGRKGTGDGCVAAFPRLRRLPGRARDAERVLAAVLRGIATPHVGLVTCRLGGSRQVHGGVANPTSRGANPV